jgi:hypothetical protein
MKDYHINVFYSEHDRCYIADIPDLKFCSACGANAEEAVHEVRSPRPPGSRWPALAANRYPSPSIGR